MKQMSLFQRVRTAGQLLTGKSLNQMQLAQFFTSRGGGGGVRPTNSYSMVAAVYSCVRARAMAISGMPLMLSTGTDEVIESGPVVDLIAQPGNWRRISPPVVRACTRLCATYGEAEARRLIDAIGRQTLDETTRASMIGKVIVDTRDLDGFVCLAAKLSRHAALSCDQVRGIIGRKIDAMVALPLPKGVDRG